MPEPRWATEADLQRWEAKQREKAASNGHVRAPPKTEPSRHYTKIPNWMFDIAGEKNLDASSTVVLLQIGRLTYGMHSPTLSVVISVEHLAARCNFSAATCKRALNRLIEVGIIRREKRTEKSGRQVASVLALVLDG